MIKSLLNADEEPPERTQVIIEEKIIPPPLSEPSTPVNLESRPIFEIPEDAKFFAPPPEKIEQTPQFSETTAPILEEVKDESDILELPEIETANLPNEEKVTAAPPEILIANDLKPISKAETIRQSGMAYSAAIVFFGSIVFMMILGWLADWLLGSNPWGVVGGIILGGIIGFVQFFRITSQIFKDQG
jgi:F0F1-type ATP synthase assembly protein I